MDQCFCERDNIKDIFPIALFFSCFVIWHLNDHMYHMSLINSPFLHEIWIYNDKNEAGRNNLLVHCKVLIV